MIRIITGSGRDLVREIKEMIHIIFDVIGHLVVAVLWFAVICVCIALVVATPVLVVAGMYKVICLVCHMTFTWTVPIEFGLALLALFGFFTADADF